MGKVYCKYCHHFDGTNCYGKMKKLKSAYAPVTVPAWDIEEKNKNNDCKQYRKGSVINKVLNGIDVFEYAFHWMGKEYHKGE